MGNDLRAIELSVHRKIDLLGLLGPGHDVIVVRGKDDVRVCDKQTNILVTSFTVPEWEFLVEAGQARVNKESDDGKDRGRWEPHQTRHIS